MFKPGDSRQAQHCHPERSEGSGAVADVPPGFLAAIGMT